MDLYNDSHEKVCILSGIKETCITSTLKTGDKEITFEFRKTNRYAADIKEEDISEPTRTNLLSSRSSRAGNGTNAPEH